MNLMKITVYLSVCLLCIHCVAFFIYMFFKKDDDLLEILQRSLQSRSLMVEIHNTYFHILG